MLNTPLNWEKSTYPRLGDCGGGLCLTMIVVMNENITLFKALSDVTDLCEQAMTTGADTGSISQVISTAEDKYRPRDLRGLSPDKIHHYLVSWKNKMIDLMRKRYTITGPIVISSANESGNASVSDLIITDSDGIQYHVETKFGNHTNAAAGLARVSAVLLDKECFRIDDNHKRSIIESYLGEGEKQAKKLLFDLIAEEVSSFPQGSQACSRSLYDMMRASGSVGNSDLIEHYSIVVFKSSRNEPLVYEEPLNISLDDHWLVSASTGTDKNTPRLTYNLHTVDGSKTVRMVHNNKNNLYVIKDDDQWRVLNSKEKKLLSGSPDVKVIPSRFQAGTASYNIWYQEKKPLSL